jgi:ectoine hydroxylase-related dioxygenase (phytanoyl-CoA dioxygenase family)
MTTIDLDRAASDLRQNGLCIVPDALDDDTLDTARAALYDAAARDRAEGREVRFGLDYATDTSNQRVWNLPNRHPVFCALAEHPAALALVRGTLGWPALLSNISANITAPGGGEMVLHADQLYMPQPWSGIQGINVLWCLDDFTDENGATRYVPGSHERNRAPTADDQGADTVPIEAPAGSMVAMEGRVWHKTGNNRTADRRRAGVFAWYTTPIYRPQENWFLALDDQVVDTASDDLLVLLGYRAIGLGLVNGASPR